MAHPGRSERWKLTSAYAPQGAVSESGGGESAMIWAYLNFQSNDDPIAKLKLSN